jgi:hypothetical protein
VVRLNRLRVGDHVVEIAVDDRGRLRERGSRTEEQGESREREAAAGSEGSHDTTAPWRQVANVDFM